MFKKIATNTIAQIISKVLTAGISIFLIGILTNYLSLEGYGLYSKIYNYTGIFVFLADLGLYAITIKEISKDKKNSAKIVGNVMSLRLILGIFILFLSIGIAFFMPGYNSSLALISIFIASIFTILQLINSSILALMQANMKMEFSAFSLVFSKLLNLGLISIIVYFLFPKSGSSDYFLSFIYIMCAGVLHVFINTILNYFYARKIVKFGFCFDLDYIKYIFKISLPYGIALFLSVFYFKLDIMLISIMEGPVKGDLSTALYSVPMKIIEVIMVIGGFYMTSILPSLSSYFKNLKENKNEEKLRNLINLSFKVLFSFSVVFVSLGILFRDEMILMIANENYLNPNLLYNSSDAFLIVFATLLFYYLSLVFIYSLVASDNQAKLLKINIIVTIFNFLGNIILIPKYSFVGAGVITVLSQILLFVLGFFTLKKIINFSLPINFMIKSLFFGIFIYLIGTFILENYSLGIYFDFFVYGGILFGFFCIYYFWEFRKKLEN